VLVSVFMGHYTLICVAPETDIFLEVNRIAEYHLKVISLVVANISAFSMRIKISWMDCKAPHT